MSHLTFWLSVFSGNLLGYVGLCGAYHEGPLSEKTGTLKHWVFNFLGIRLSLGKQFTRLKPQLEMD